MNPGQEQFYNFILERVQEDKTDEAKELLQDAFDKQADGSFNAEYLLHFGPKLLGLLKDEFVDEVKGITEQFGKSM